MIEGPVISKYMYVCIFIFGHMLRKIGSKHETVWSIVVVYFYTLPQCGFKCNYVMFGECRFFSIALPAWENDYGNTQFEDIEQNKDLNLDMLTGSELASQAF